MIAMQYSFTLPAAFDMAVIRERIATKGRLLDNFPGLVLKAYLHADRNSSLLHTFENLYAPLYLWEGSEGMNSFLCSDGFKALAETFGWPTVRSWLVVHSELSEATRDARFATREIAAIAPFSSLANFMRSEAEDAASDVLAGGALASVAAYEPTTWTSMRWRLWKAIPGDFDRRQVQCYEVGYVTETAWTAKQAVRELNGRVARA